MISIKIVILLSLAVYVWCGCNNSKEKGYEDLRAIEKVPLNSEASSSGPVVNQDNESDKPQHQKEKVHSQRKQKKNKLQVNKPGNTQEHGVGDSSHSSETIGVAFPHDGAIVNAQIDSRLKKQSSNIESDGPGLRINDKEVPKKE